MSWQRGYLLGLTLLGEHDFEGSYTHSADGDAFADELARATSREARARLLAREATGILVELQALGVQP